MVRLGIFGRDEGLSGQSLDLDTGSISPLVATECTTAGALRVQANGGGGGGGGVLIAAHAISVRPLTSHSGGRGGGGHSRRALLLTEVYVATNPQALSCTPTHFKSVKRNSCLTG